MEFKLYNYYRSSCSYRVRIALELKSIEYSYIPIHLLNDGGEQKTHEYRKLNSKQEVPTLIHDDTPISESMAIIEYLDEVRPEPLLFPTDILQKTFVRQACEIINSGIQPLQNLSVLNKLVDDFAITPEQKIKWVQDIVIHGLTSFERFISNKSGKYCFGDSITAADLFLVPQVFSSLRFKVDISQFQILEQIYNQCTQLEAFRKAHPAVQPDTPKK